MINSIPDGVWPTIVTPFTDENKIDYHGVEAMIEWYLRQGVAGLFAVSQSSEMFYLSLAERIELAGFVREKVGGRVPVIASGHISSDFAEQVKEVRAIADTGVDALVLVSNRLAPENESDDQWKRNMEKLLHEVSAVSLGLYECPHPYKRLLSPELLHWSASTGRFLFLKDTCCDLGQLQAKIEAVKGTGLKIFNANAATLLASLKLGASGYSGVMANFHPDLYVWLMRNWSVEPERAEELQNFLGLASLIEKQLYPVNAKYYLQLEGLPVSLNCRWKDPTLFTSANRLEIEQLRSLSKTYTKIYKKI